MEKEFQCDHASIGRSLSGKHMYSMCIKTKQKIHLVNSNF